MPTRGSSFDALPGGDDVAVLAVDEPVVGGVVSVVDGSTVDGVVSAVVVESVSVVDVSGWVVDIDESVVVLVSAVVVVVSVSPSAHATPGMLATAAPIPNATAKVPTRPM